MKTDSSPAMERLVSALIAWGATASQIAAHMSAWERSGSPHAATSSVDAFRDVVVGVVTPLLTDQTDEALAQAAHLVEQVDALVVAEIVLVPPPGRTAGT
jgi:hypothetical protein